MSIFIFSSGKDNIVRKIDPDTMTEIANFDGHQGAAGGTAIDAGLDGFLYSGGSDKTVRKINPDTMEEITPRFTGHTNDVLGVVIGDDGFLYTRSEDFTVRKIDPETMTQVGIFDAFADQIFSLVYGDDGFLYAGDGDFNLRKIDPSTMTQVDNFTGHSNDVFGLAYGDDGLLYSGSRDNTTKKINPVGMSEIDSAVLVSDWITGVAQKGDFIYVHARDASVRKVATSDLSQVDSFSGTDEFRAMHISNSDGYLYVGGDDNLVRRIDRTDMSQVGSSFSGHTDSVLSITQTKALGPTTPEQIFNATYADASAAPPKQTALVRPLDVQRSIDTDVSWLSQNPKEWTLEVIISVGELQHYRPGNVFFVRADVPGLRAGRKVLLKGFSASDIRPTEPVTCVFTAPSETA